MSINTGSSALNAGLVEAPDATLSFNRDGSMGGSFFWNTMSGAASGLAIGQSHPYDSRAHIAQYAYHWDESHIIGASAEYVGVWSSTVNAVDAIATTQQEPIVTHPAFAVAVSGKGPLGGTYGTGNNKHNAQFDGDPSATPPTGSGDFICFPATLDDKTTKNPLGGVTAYLNPGLTIRLTYTTTSQGTVESSVGKVGTIQNSLTAGSITYGYSYPAWMCTNVTYKEVLVGSAGSVFNVTEEWLFSQGPGWNSDIYPIPAP